MEMDGVGMERQSSIENEPRTLNIHQLEFAREAAIYVVNTRGIEEALRIFTEGLEPVVSCAQGGRSNSGGHSEEEDGKYGNNEVVKIPAGLRDIVSAPF